MEATVNIETYTLQIPQTDARFLSALVKKMGWERENCQKEWVGNGFGKYRKRRLKESLITMDVQPSLILLHLR